jgi:hypothetical protein
MDDEFGSSSVVCGGSNDFVVAVVLVYSSVISGIFHNYINILKVEKILS